MEGDFQEGHELQGSNTELTDGVMDPPQDQLDRIAQDKCNQNTNSLKQDHIKDQVQDKENNVENAAKEQKQWEPDLPQHQFEIHLPDLSPAEVDPSTVHHHQLGSDVDLLQDEKNSGLSPSHLDRDQIQAEHQDHAGSHQDQEDQELMSAAANKDKAGESGGSVPALLISQAEETSALTALLQSAASTAEPSDSQRPSDLVFTDPGVSSSPDGGDMGSSDLLSLRSDSLSLASEPTVSRRSEEDDTRSVTASSFMVSSRLCVAVALQGGQHSASPPPLCFHDDFPSLLSSHPLPADQL
ncbi:uncharacterized protein [Channa argus]|uniref:uncharacterized protein n=1 Tax=Channa argus TaxID=215402 RepID=UPI0029465E98|nr:hypothetical protein Q8A73_023354 [Channa argus]